MNTKPNSPSLTTEDILIGLEYIAMPLTLYQDAEGISASTAINDALTQLHILKVDLMVLRDIEETLKHE